MDQSRERARGRARGRGRSQQQQQQQQQQTRRPGDAPAYTQTAGSAPSRASHRPSAARDAAGGAGDQPLVTKMSALAVSSVVDSTEAQASSASGAAVQSVGRGAARGRREIFQERAIEVTRPATVVTKIGGQGQPIQLLTNYFPLIDRTSWTMKQYCVSFDPPEDNTRMRKKLLRVHQTKLGQHYVFDGAMLFMEKALEDKEVEYLSKRETDDQQVRVMIKFVREVSPSDYTFLHIFNIITNQCMSLINLKKLKKIDREYFDVEDAKTANHGMLEIWPGFRAAVAQHESQVLMCVAVSHKVLRTDTVLDQLRAIQSQGMQGRGQGDVIHNAERQLLGSIVMCRHNLKTYRVDEILWKESPNSKFDYKGRQISIKDYFKERYNLNMTLEQPLICSRPKKREMRAGQDQPYWLVPELCCMTGLSDEMRNDFRMMKELGGFLNMPPQQRVQKLNTFSRRLNGSAPVRELLSSWGLKFADNLLAVQGRVMNPEKILAGRESVAQDGSWNDAVKTGLRAVVNLRKWVVFYSSRCMEEARKCVTGVIQTAAGFGMEIAQPDLFQVSVDHVGAFVNTVRQQVRDEHQLVMCVIPNKDKNRYDALKQLLCVHLPRPSQIVTGKLIRTNKNLPSVVTKIAIQINCKLGGVPWEVRVPLKDVMVIGYDTYHEAERKDASVGAWVATMDQNCGRYFSCATIHTNREELCSHMEANMLKSLEAYRRHNSKYPEYVFMYRDGVGEGQIRYVRDVELVSLKKSLAERCPDAKLTFIIVTKIINTRFFFKGDRSGNPPPGTVVDDHVTLPQRYDFYLVSQKTRIGTVTPVMYNVIHDECHLKPDHLQILTYKLTHMYFNMSSTVRVPAPCLCAHRLAFLVGTSIHSEPNPILSNELFFL